MPEYLNEPKLVASHAELLADVLMMLDWLSDSHPPSLTEFANKHRLIDRNDLLEQMKNRLTNSRSNAEAVKPKRDIFREPKVGDAFGDDESHWLIVAVGKDGDVCTMHSKNGGLGITSSGTLEQLRGRECYRVIRRAEEGEGK